jgi:hypothetical protein
LQIFPGFFFAGALTGNPCVAGKVFPARIGNHSGETPRVSPEAARCPAFAVALVQARSHP